MDIVGLSLTTVI